MKKRLILTPMSLGALSFWLIVVGVALAFFVGYGWWLLIQNYFESAAVAVVIAALIAVLALLFARMFGQKRAAHVQDERSEFRWWRGGVLYAVLFVLSALGTVNAAFVLFEGPSVVRQDVSEVRTAYHHLQNEANVRLRSTDYDEKAEKVSSLLVSLEKEINNPNGGNFCGVGTAADAIIEQIREIVPRMPIIRGTGVIRPCDRERAERVFNAYKESALAALSSDPTFINGNGPAKYQYLANLQQHVTQTDGQLDQVVGALTSLNSFKKPEVQGGLEQAAGAYESDAVGLRRFVSPLPKGVPDSVDVSQSHDLGSLAAVFSILWSRLFHWVTAFSTVFYVAIAVALDLALVGLLTQAFLRMPAAEKEEFDAYKRAGLLPKFLWVNPLQNPRTARHV